MRCASTTSDALPRELNITIVSAGDGKSYPQHGQTVSVHYDAFLADGSKWDSSRARGKPLRFKIGIGQVIRGLDEGVRLMSLNERVRLHIKATWAYSSRGFPGRVPPNTDVMFDVQLVDLA